MEKYAAELEAEARLIEMSRTLPNRIIPCSERIVDVSVAAIFKNMRAASHCHVLQIPT